jgi:NitT/TauT family transport system substrate-binding protein
MRKLFALGAAFGALLLVCGAAKPASAVELTKLICAFTFWPGQGVYILADKLGYLKEEGIEMEFVQEDDIQVQTEAMEAGHINCNSRTIGEYLSRPRDASTKGIVVGAMDFSRGGDGVIASGDIKDPCDLKGKTFAMEPTLPANLLLQLKLKEKCGMTLKDLNILHIATADGLAVFADPKVDVIESYEPLLSQILQANVRPGAYKLVDSSDYPELIIDIFYLDNDLIKQNPELVRAMLRATYRAADYYFKNPDKANELMAPAFNLTPAEMAEAMKGLKFTTYEEALDLFGTNEKPGRFKQVFDTVMQLNIEQGVADAPLKYENQVDASLLVDLFKGHTR